MECISKRRLGAEWVKTLLNEWSCSGLTGEVCVCVSGSADSGQTTLSNISSVNRKALKKMGFEFRFSEGGDEVFFQRRENGVFVMGINEDAAKNHFFDIISWFPPFGIQNDWGGEALIRLDIPTQTISVEGMVYSDSGEFVLETQEFCYRL